MAVTAPVAAAPTAARRARRHRPDNTLLAGIGLLGLLILFSLLAGGISSYTTTALSADTFSGPTGTHWLGSDNLGRDLFVRVGEATRSSLLISAAATTLAALIGVPIGLWAGYKGGTSDQIAMRGVDLFMALPPILEALVIGVVFGLGTMPLIVGMGIIFAPFYARVMRGPALALREREFVLAAQLSGTSSTTIIARHLFPNALTPMLIQFANTASIAVLLEAGLSYLGQGVQPPNPSAGRMISEAQRYMSDAPWMMIVPAASIIAMSFAWNLIADGLQVALAVNRGPRKGPVSPVDDEALPIEPTALVDPAEVIRVDHTESSLV